MQQPLPVIVLPGFGQWAWQVVDAPILHMTAKRVFYLKNGAFVQARSSSTYDGNLDVYVANPFDPLGPVEINADFEARQIPRFISFLRTQPGFVDQVVPSAATYNLVGVSMGGVIARQMIMRHTAELGGVLPSKLILLAAPNHGADLDVIAHTHIPIPLLLPASGDLHPHSPLLNGLNGQTIPESIRVFTIACEARVQKTTRVRPHSSDRIQVGRVYWDVPCTHPFIFINGEIVGIGTDGMVRVNSVRLEPSEAATIVCQEVVSDVWHNGWVRNRANWATEAGVTPRERKFLDARDAAAGDFVSSSVDGFNVSQDFIEKSPKVAERLNAILEAP